MFLALVALLLRPKRTVGCLHAHDAALQLPLVVVLPLQSLLLGSVVLFAPGPQADWGYCFGYAVLG